jgi:hypothetical protein
VRLTVAGAGNAAGRPNTVTWRLQAAAYDVLAENRLMLVVNSRDQLYSDDNPSFSTLQISSAAGDESCLEPPSAELDGPQLDGPQLAVPGLISGASLDSSRNPSP